MGTPQCVGRLKCCSYIPARCVVMPPQPALSIVGETVRATSNRTPQMVEAAQPPTRLRRVQQLLNVNAGLQSYQHSICIPLHVESGANWQRKCCGHAQTVQALLTKETSALSIFSEEPGPMSA